MHATDLDSLARAAGRSLHLLHVEVAGWAEGREPCRLLSSAARPRQGPDSDLRPRAALLPKEEEPAVRWGSHK